MKPLTPYISFQKENYNSTKNKYVLKHERRLHGQKPTTTVWHLPLEKTVGAHGWTQTKTNVVTIERPQVRQRGKQLANQIIQRSGTYRDWMDKQISDERQRPKSWRGNKIQQGDTKWKYSASSYTVQQIVHLQQQNTQHFQKPWGRYYQVHGGWKRKCTYAPSTNVKFRI